MQASVRCLAPLGRLLEIGKFDMSVGSTLPMRPMLRGVSFEAICLELILDEGPGFDPFMVTPNMLCWMGQMLRKLDPATCLTINYVT